MTLIDYIGIAFGVLVVGILVYKFFGKKDSNNGCGCGKCG